MNFDKSSLLLYAVTDRSLTGGRDFCHLAEEALKGGVTALQLREKDLDPGRFLEEAGVIQKLCRRYRVPLIINDRLDIALAVGADGIHVGQDDLSVAEIRAIAGPGLFIGASVHSLEEAERAVREGADYLGLGAVFPTATKEDVTLMDRSLLKKIAGSSPLPAVAIGGIQAANILDLSGTGISGVAVVSAIFGQDDPRRAARELLLLSEKIAGPMDKGYAIFDLDGTLVDSMPYWRNLARTYLTRRGLTKDLDALTEEVRTLTISESANLFIRHFGLADDPDRIVRDLNRTMAGHYQQDIPLKEGAADYLEDLKEKGVRMCVASATALPLIEACLDRLGVLPYFEFLLSCEGLKTSKRRPDIYLMAAERFQAAPSEIAVFEDAYYAARTAKEAGFYLVGVQDQAEADKWDRILDLADRSMAF